MLCCACAVHVLCMCCVCAPVRDLHCAALFFPSFFLDMIVCLLFRVDRCASGRAVSTLGSANAQGLADLGRAGHLYGNFDIRLDQSPLIGYLACLVLPIHAWYSYMLSTPISHRFLCSTPPHMRRVTRFFNIFLK